MIVRVEHQRSYAVIQNATLRDKRLSFKARGLLAYLLSLPDNATITREKLAKVGPDGERSVRTALAELADAGYLQRIEVRRPDGRFHIETVLREEPLDPNAPPDLDPTLFPPPTGGRKRTSGSKQGKRSSDPGGAAGADRTSRADQPKQGKTAGQTAGQNRTSQSFKVPIEVPLVVPALKSLAGTLAAVIDPASTTKRDGSAKAPKLKPKAKPPVHRDPLALRLWERFPDLDYEGALGMVNELRELNVADTVIDEGIGYTLQRPDIGSPRFLVSVVTDWFNQRTAG